MSGTDPSAAPYRVAVTGAAGDLGQLLVPLLEADPLVERIVAIDSAKPASHGPKVEFRRIDLAQSSAEAELRHLLAEGQIDVVYHLAFLFGRVHSASFAHELEVIGTHQVLTAVAQAQVRQLIVPSLTVLYGARPEHPALLTEDVPLKGCVGSRFVNDKVEVEKQFDDFRQKYPNTQVTVLRFAPIVGPSVNNPLTRLLRTRLVPTLLGFDPLWQVIHEDDAARALHWVLGRNADGAFNLVAPGVLPFSRLVLASGGAVVPLPAFLARAAIAVLETVGLASVPLPLLDYLHYSWVADGHRAEQELGFVPRYRSIDAVASLRGA